jgi:Transposase DDE domain
MSDSLLSWRSVALPGPEREDFHAATLAHFHRQPSKALCLKLSRSRWHVEQYFQRSKDDLGLDHYEGRSWRGFHHHLVMSAIAYLFILTTYLAAKKTSGLTLEKILEAIRPWLLRSTGRYPYCHSTFPEKIDDST